MDKGEEGQNKSPDSWSGSVITPQHGVVTLFGYGIQARVDRGHLLLEDGIGVARRHARFPRVGHGLRRLVVIGSDGIVSLAALRWLADQNAAFVMLDRDGSVLATTGPVHPSDARLRRAQALAEQSGTAIRIARELIDKKLAGQEHVARSKLLTDQSADTIFHYRAELSSADTLERIRLLESRAAAAYWAVWRNLPVNFPKKDELRVPDHWRTFGARVSPLTGSPRVAVNPPNAMLNYLYALLESESRLAAAALGLDPGLGVLHVDAPARDSLACDLMEPVRPQVDAFLLDWITRDLLKREWFFERPDGNCRLMSSLAIRLSETAPIWGRAVAPLAEWVGQSLWNSPHKRSGVNQILPTRLTQRRKRNAKGSLHQPPTIRAPRRENLCRGCGKPIQDRSTNCAQCDAKAGRMVDVAQIGRIAGHTPEAVAKESRTQRLHAQARSAWTPAKQPAWLTEQVFSEKIRPALAQASATAIAKKIGVSRWYAGRIREGYRPHPRHWQALARLAGVSAEVEGEGEGENSS